MNGSTQSLPQSSGAVVTLLASVAASRKGRNAENVEAELPPVEADNSDDKAAIDCMLDEFLATCKRCGRDVEDNHGKECWRQYQDPGAGAWCNRFDTEDCELFVECASCVEIMECATCGFYVCPYCREQDRLGHRFESSVCHDSRVFVTSCGGCRRKCCQAAVRGAEYIPVPLPTSSSSRSKTNPSKSAGGRSNSSCSSANAHIHGDGGGTCAKHCDFCHKNLCPVCMGQYWQCPDCVEECREDALHFGAGGEATTMCGICIAQRTVSTPAEGAAGRAKTLKADKKTKSAAAVAVRPGGRTLVAQGMIGVECPYHLPGGKQG